MRCENCLCALNRFLLLLISLCRILSASSLMIILTLFSDTFSFDLKCLEKLYSEVCVVYDLEITSPDDTITSVDGNTDPSDYYLSLQIKNQKVNFIPKNIASFFPQLEELEISSSGLEWIEQVNIRELPNLKKLNLEKNKLEILEKDLFDFNTELETINISANQLKYVNKDIFYKLSNLRSVYLGQNTCTNTFYSNYQYNFEQNYNGYRYEVKEQLNRYCQSWENAYSIYERKFNKKINDLQSQNEKLTHRLKTCDGNLDAALTNFRQQKLVNSRTEFTDRTNDLPVIKLTCEGEQCIAIDFKVSFSNSSIESENYSQTIITSLNIHQQQTLFLPQNLAEHFSMLNELLVIECGLSEIDYNVFKGLAFLVTLNLTNNKIPEIPVDTFTDLEDLQELDLSFNKIHTLYDDVFNSLKGLQKLFLNNNYLTSIKIELLQNLKSLNGLFLQNNLLKFIGATLLTPLNSLESVDLSGNVCINMSLPTSSLIEVETTIVDNCIAPVELNCQEVLIETSQNVGNYSYCRVEDLFIEYPKTKISKVNGGQGLNNSVNIFFADQQSIKYFPFQLSQQFPNLERIEIQQSKLSSLNQTDFDGFAKLAQIVMNNNNLSSISEGSFHSVPELKLLDLSSNNIVSLPAKIFIKLTRLQTLLLSNNRIFKFTADFLPRKNMIDVFRADNNQLEFIETKTLRFLRKAKLIDLTGNICIDMKFDKAENSTRALVELSGEIDLNCSADD